VTNPSVAPVSPLRSKGGWGIRRILIAGACGAMLAGIDLILNFWPLGARGSVGFVARALFDFSRVLFVLPLAGFIVGLLIAAGIARWRRHFRRAASSVCAIAAIPVCIVVVAKVPLFDPWLWYAIANGTRFEAMAERGPPADGPKYAVVEISDVSTGLVGVNPAHVIALIYDESDALGLEPPERPSIWQTRSIWPALGSTPIPRGKRLYGHLFRVDIFT